MNKVWHDKAWEEYVAWQAEDKKTLKRINNLLKDIDRNPFSGIGKEIAENVARYQWMPVEIVAK